MSAAKTASEPIVAEQPSTQDVTTPTPLKKKKGPGDVFLNKLYEKMKEIAGETFTQDQFNAAVRYARSHAGGKMKGKKVETAELSYTRLIEMVNSALCEAFKKPFSNESYFYWAREIYPTYVIVCSNDDGKFYSISYTVADGEVEFEEPQEVEQTFAPVTTGEMSLFDLCADGHGARLFNELQDYAEPPDWIPYLPKPGKYTSPKYGEINITEDRITNFVKNFEDKVYQEKLPIDAEHETKLSGALGWITEMRVNDDGSVDAKAEWTDRGTTLIEADRFKYFSPEWFEEWTDPATEEKHSDVAVGGALTTRPFFKEKALRPLVASERGIEMSDVEPKELSNQQLVIFTALAPIKEKSMSTATEDKTGVENKPEQIDAQKFAEMQTSLQAAEAKVQAAEEENRKLAERTASLEKDARSKRFSDTINDAAGNGAKRFIGATEDHLSFMEFIAEHDGETSDRMSKYVEQQRAHAEQVRASGVFKEIGRTGEGENTALAQLDAKAKALQASETGLTYAVAYDRVMAENPELYRQSLKEGK
jgi:hypothetical protein